MIMSNSTYNQLTANLELMKLTQMKLHLDEIRDFVTTNGLSFTEGLLKLSSYEVDFKEQNASRSMIKAAAFPFVKELKDYDFEFQPSVNEQEMRELASLGFGRRATPAQKTQVVQKLRQRHALDILLSIAQLPRATFYYHLKRMRCADKYEEAKTEITAIYHENKGRYGYRRITTTLHNRGIHLNHKTVQRLMRQLGLACRVRIKKYRSYKGEVGKIAPNLLNRNFYAEKPNQKWVTDVTEFSLFGQKLYLSPILDLHNGYLVSYTIFD